MSGLWVAMAAAATITVPVVTQLHESQRNLLPDKTIEATYKTLEYGKNINPSTAVALDSLMQIVADNAYQCRTFELFINGDNDTVETTIIYTDPTQKDDKQQRQGTLIKDGRHFLVTCDKANEKWVKALFTDGRDKVKYVREFEMVEELMPQPETQVTALITHGQTKITHYMVEGEDHTVSE